MGPNFSQYSLSFIDGSMSNFENNSLGSTYFEPFWGLFSFEIGNDEKCNNACNCCLVRISF